ncbi:MAG: phosphoribosylglycinamide formyltransferase, partial [Clostridia bacterium]|nr:phosphoribosylglycinamide formyltransferase [Clostridia bacterium]
CANLAVTFPVGMLIRRAIPNLGERAEAICQAKLDQSFGSTLIRAIFCGVLMYIAVEIFRSKKSPIGVLFGIPVFILAGFEHSIADMFYFGASGIASGKIASFEVAAVLGNSIGSVILPLLAVLGGLGQRKRIRRRKTPKPPPRRANRMRDKARIAVLVSGGGTNLQALIDAERTGIIENGKIVLVISNKAGVYALERAKNAGIPTATFEKKACGGQEGMEREIRRALDDARVDLIVLAGFLSILSPDFTRDYDHRIVNVHPSLIPSFCGEGFYGLRVHEAALARGVKVTGATVHFVNEIPDGGEIILQKPVKILKTDTPETLQKRVMRIAEWKILPAAVELVSKQIRFEER